jgi:hypothetical protein
MNIIFMSFLFDFLRYVGIYENIIYFCINHGLNNVRNWGLTAGRGKVLLVKDSIQTVYAACLLPSSYWK